MSFVVGDKLICKTGHELITGFTTGRGYEITEILYKYNPSEYILFFKVADDLGTNWLFAINNNHIYYHGKYFYTKEEIRDIRLKDLLE